MSQENDEINQVLLAMCGRQPAPAPEPEPDPLKEGQLRLKRRPGDSNENAEMNSILLGIATR
jgi:hypothetical protein